MEKTPILLTLLGIGFFGFPQAHGAETATFTYDKLYRLKSANYSTVEISYSYDTAGNIVKITQLAKNSAPTSIVLSSGSVQENQVAGSTVGTLSTTDPDAGDTFTYSLVSGAGSTDNGAFSIAGNILKTAAVFDYETKNSYSIRVRTTDSKGLYYEKQFTISITNINEAPTNLALSASSVAENQPAGTAIGTLSTTDPDSGDTFTYSLVNGAGSTDKGAFSIAGNILKTAAVFDYETKNSYSIRVRTTDSKGLYYEKQFTISVTNINEAPTNLSLSASSVAENQPAGTAVSILSTTDPDAGDMFTYSLVSGAGSTDNGAFSIAGNILKTAAVFDYETKGSYSIRVRTTDSKGLYYEKQFTISVTNINEAPTNLALSASSVAENQPAGTVVGTLSTADPDAGDTFTYSLVSGAGSTDNGAFSIAGNILKTAAVFDYETKGSYSIRVRTTDSKGLYYEKQLIIYITDNLNQPCAFTVSGVQFLCNGTPFSIKGVHYSPVPIGVYPEITVPHGDYFTSEYAGIQDRDLGLLRQMGANAVLIPYWGNTADHNAFLDKAYNNGVNPIYIISGFWINAGLNIDPASDLNKRAQIKADFLDMVETHRNHPAIMLWSIGSDLNSSAMYGSTMTNLLSLIEEMAVAAQTVEGSASHPVAVGLADVNIASTISAYESAAPHVDIWGISSYRGNSFGTLFADISAKSTKPLVILGYGIDAYDNAHATEYEKLGAPLQKNYAQTLWGEIAAHAASCVGGVVNEYSDEWWRGVQSSGAGCPDINPSVQSACGRSDSSQPDGFLNEEWRGITRVKDNGSNPDVVEPRESYYAMQTFWASGLGDPIILDNATAGASAAGLSFMGQWCASTSPGYYGKDSLYSCGAGTDTYRFTPTIPTAGTYRVFIRWTSHVNRSKTVPISIVASSGMTTMSLDQQTGGGSWVNLGIFEFAAGSGGYVEVSDVNGQACADAVMFVPEVPPQAVVTITATDPNAAENPLDLGVFTVTRTGSTAAALTVNYTVGGNATPGVDYTALSGSVTFLIGKETATVTVTPVNDALVEDNETVVLTLSAGAGYAVGTPSSATVTITSDDVGEIILDNAPAGQGDASRSFTGTWAKSGSSGAYGPDSLYSNGSGVDTYRWTPMIPAAGTYEVYVWWTAYNTRSSSVPISVNHAGGKTTKSYDQKVDGAQWVLHGTYNFNAGTGGYVEVAESAATGQQACADAVKFVPAAAPPPEIILDNAPAGQSGGGRSYTGTWVKSGASGAYGPDSLYSNGSGVDTYRWTPTIPAAGTYEVYVWWTAYSTRSSSVPIAVNHAGGKTTKSYDQKLDGGKWVLHGTYSFNAGTVGYVEVAESAVTGQQACADAVKFVPVAAPPATSTVTIAATDPNAAEKPLDTGVFTVSRTGSTAAALTVGYTVDGTATPGSDYTALSGSVTIPIGSLTATVTVTPVNDALVEGNETVVATLNAGAGYAVGTPSSATVTIASDDVPGGEIILDNAPAGQSGGGRSFTGTWVKSSALGAYGPDSLYSNGSGVDTYRWTPTIPAAGTYEVYVWWTAYSTRSSSVPIAVNHAGGKTTLTVDQKADGGKWVLHGTYSFNAGTGGYVEVAESAATGQQACADAVRFVPVP